MIPAGLVEAVPDFTAFGVRAFTTTRQFGSFGSNGGEAVREVMGRWDAVRKYLGDENVRRLATASQVHGADVTTHREGWEGWLRGASADGHFSASRGTALAVTIADCVPVFLAHPSGASAVLHSGWRGTAARIVGQGIARFVELGSNPADIRIHLGPAICGTCYEVSPEVTEALTGRNVERAQPVDLRELIAATARAAGVRQITISSWCTRHHNDRFFSHRAGDAGRQVGVIFASAR